MRSWKTKEKNEFYDEIKFGPIEDYQSARIEAFVTGDTADFDADRLGVERSQRVHLQGNGQTSHVPGWHTEKFEKS